MEFLIPNIKFNFIWQVNEKSIIYYYHFFFFFFFFFIPGSQQLSSHWLTKKLVYFVCEMMNQRIRTNSSLGVPVCFWYHSLIEIKNVVL